MNNETNPRQLHKPLGQFRIFSHYSVDRVHTKDGANLPFMIWPNGSPCIIGNLYIQSLLERRGRGGRQGLSRRGRNGGSMGDYAGKIGQLLRRCYRDKLDLIHLSDQSFTDYIEEIRKERSSRNPEHRKKSENTVLSTGRVWLDFLSFIGRFYGDPDFVSPNGTIRAREESYTLKARNGLLIKRTYLTHHSFGPDNRKHRRIPITSEQVYKLKQAILKANTSNFVKQRRHCLIELLKDTGGRRSEVGNIKIDDVLTAYNSDQPLLRLETLKQGDRAERYVRVTKMLLHDIKSYIEFARRKLMKSVYKDGVDHGFLFVSETTGRKISNETISNEINELRKIANMNEQVCAHMFRHAFITNLFSLLIQRHEISNEDQFRQRLLDSHTFIAEIMQWTGQLEPSSVEYYINLAFRSVANYSKTTDSVNLIRAMDKFFDMQSQLIDLLEHGMPIAEYRSRVEKLKQLAEQDYKMVRNIDHLTL